MSVECKYGRVIIGLRSRFLDLLKVCCFLSPSQDQRVRSNKEDLLQEERVTDQRKSSYRLAMSTIETLVYG